MTHLDHCMAELDAELDALLARDACALALAQLDAREARGETLDVVDPRLLRRRLEAQLARSRHARAKLALAELRRTLSAGDERSEPTASGETAAAHPQAGVVPIAAARARRRRTSEFGGGLARSAIVAMALAFAAMWLVPRHMGDALIVGPSQTSVLGMACTVIGCRIEASAR